MDVCFLLYKQKRAYEMRISDWSSDVCSSDLHEILIDLQDLGHGPVIARFQQRIGSREVFNRQISVAMDRSGRPVAVSGYFANSDDVKQAATLSFAGDAAMSALATAFRQLGVTVTRDRKSTRLNSSH